MSRTYSVWNGPRKRYDYYVAPGVEAHTPARGLAKPSSDVGMSPNAAAWPLPDNARPAGSGADARGTVAVVKQLAGLSGDDSVSGNLTSIAIFGGAIYLAWKFVIKGKKT